METARLYFREQTKEQLEIVVNQTQEEQLLFFGFENVDQLNSELSKVKTRLLKKDKIDWKIWDLVEKRSGNVIGCCLLHNWVNAHERAELGYSLHEPYRKMGFMSEAIPMVLQFGFEDMKLNRIEAFIGPDNLPSIKLIKSFGFTKEGLMREHYKYENFIYDSLVFSLLKREYFTAK
jgi:[ribosomal protein S5]-alanine N-acetyltransferase